MTIVSENGTPLFENDQNLFKKSEMSEYFLMIVPKEKEDKQKKQHFPTAAAAQTTQFRPFGTGNEEKSEIINFNYFKFISIFRPTPTLSNSSSSSNDTVPSFRHRK